MTARTGVLAGLLLLAGCGGGGEGGNGSDDGGGNNTAVPATVPEPVNESLVQDPQNHAVPLDPPADQRK